ncbi:DnaJ domain-containing protein [Natrarchaeobius sp. A-rgal3]|uniref:DnaJ domain-containing protein n=1 Tax=Natrarchaeobius versutus TaxID=1679078 RepID=UPI00350FD165
MGETYYDVLEVDPDASEDRIREAYRERVLETHPDHNDAPDAAEQFQRVSTAESVLTDEAERVRYDRLGHDAYVRLAEHSGQTTADSSRESDADQGRSENREGRGAETNSRGQHSTRTSGGRHASSDSSNRHASSDSRGRNATGSSSGRRDTGTSAGGYGSSHHARHRRNRQRSKSRQSSADPFASAGFTDADRKRTTRTNTDRVGSTRATTDETDGETAESEASGFRYSVKDWDGDVDLEWEGRSIEHSTAVTLVCIWLLYPVFVYTSVAPLVSPVFNGILILCTLGIVAYLLTMPRIATVLFGSWAVVLPVGFAAFSIADPLSLRGLLAIGFVWIPLGYSVALWWALRP